MSNVIVHGLWVGLGLEADRLQRTKDVLSDVCLLMKGVYQ